MYCTSFPPALWKRNKNKRMLDNFSALDVSPSIESFSSINKVFSVLLSTSSVHSASQSDFGFFSLPNSVVCVSSSEGKQPSVDHLDLCTGLVFMVHILENHVKCFYCCSLVPVVAENTAGHL